jgi:DNA-binding winged helix-turn-helix (wHTH) protein
MTGMMSTAAERDGTLSFGPFCLRPQLRRLERGQSTVRIGSRALDLLIALAERPGEVIGHQALIDHVWPDTAVEESGLRVQIAGLRKALGDRHAGARYVATVPGRGYCFVANVLRRDDEKPGVAGSLARRALGGHEADGGIPVDVGSLVERFATSAGTPSLTVRDAHAIEQLCRRLDQLACALRNAASQAPSNR